MIATLLDSSRRFARAHAHALAAIGLAAMAASARAHTGHEVGGFGSGAVHPLGLDHLLAIVAVGLWSVSVLRRAQVWRGPALFMGSVLLGTMLGASMPAPALLEPALSASVIALGLLLACTVAGAGQHATRSRARGAWWLIAAAGVTHGLAHGAEAPLGLVPPGYVLGLLAVTAALHALGVIAGLAIERMTSQTWHTRVVRGAGAALGLTGLALVIG